MNRKGSEEGLILRNLDVLGLILSFVSFCGRNWLNVRLTCKNFLQTSFQAFDPTVNNNFALKWAIQTGCTKVVEDLLKNKRINPGMENNCSIRKACELGHLEIVKMLLKDKRVDPSAEDNNAIKAASGRLMQLYDWKCKIKRMFK